MRLRLLALLLFVSGGCALVYQTAWMRELTLVFGATSSATAAVLAIFMAGLGAGAALLGRRVDRRATRPLLVYGVLEAAIALSVPLTPLLVDAIRALYGATGGSSALGVLTTPLRLVLSALVLSVPTLAMGATLPAAARAAARPDDQRGNALAALYAANALGAVAGTLIATFVAFEALGIRGTLWTACLLNALIAATAIALGRRDTPVAEAASESPTAEAKASASPAAAIARAVPAKKSGRQRKRGKRSKQTGSMRGAATATHSRNTQRDAGAPSLRAPLRWLYPAAFTTGFAFFLLELVWYRMLAPLLGGSTYTFGLVLAAALLGIGLGAFAYRGPGRRRRPTVSGFVLVCGLEAMLVLVPLALGDDLALFAIRLRDAAHHDFGSIVLGWAAIAAIVVFPAAVASGIQFPLLVELARGDGDRMATRIGRIYAINTAGAIAGALAGGFGVIAALGAIAAWRAAALTLVALAAVAAIHALRTEPRRRAGAACTPAVIAIVLACCSAGPSAVWRHSPIGAGRAQEALASPQQQRAWRNDQRRHVVWERDGVEASIALIVDDGYALLVNGKSDGNSVGDSATQVMLGLLGPLVHPAPRNALVVGLGTGSTAGWLAAVPSIERVDVVEIESAVVEVARACAPVNRNALSDPKVHVQIGDAREVVLTAPDRYDLIVSEPSNPYRAGVASLFTREFYAGARARLAPGGLFVQWLQAYEVDMRTVAGVYATLRDELPYIHTWQTDAGDLVLVAAAQPIALDPAALRAKLALPALSAPILRVWHADDVEGLLAHFVGDERLAAELAADGAITTDDHPLIEYGFARTVGIGRFDIGELFAAVKHTRAIPDSITGVDWGRLLAVRRRDALENVTLPDGIVPDPAPMLAVTDAFARGNADAAYEQYRATPFAPRDTYELLVAATLEARANDPRALQHVDAISIVLPSEGAALRAIAAHAAGDLDRALPLAVDAIARLRADPWVPTAVIDQLLVTCVALAKTTPQRGRALFDALAEPFAVHVHDDQRLGARVVISTALDLASTCVAALDPVEPYPPWREPLLEYRVRCYTATEHPRRAAAEADLAEWRALQSR